MTDDESLKCQQDITGSDLESTTRMQPCGYLNFNFFGTATRLYANSERELLQWRYFFRDFEVSDIGMSKVISVWVSVEGSDASFIESIIRKDGAPKAIYVEHDTRFLLWSKFEKWSHIESPIPPFHFPPLCDRLLVLHASSVSPAGKGKAILFVAPPYQGKSTLANRFVELGGSPLGDNLAVLDRRNMQVLPYLTPTGIRAETINLVAGLRDVAARVPPERCTVSEITGIVYMIHFDELFDFPKPEATQPGIIVHLANHRGQLGKRFQIQNISDREAKERLQHFSLRTPNSTGGVENALERLISETDSLLLDYDLLNTDIDDVVAEITAACA